jgi:transposase
MIRIDEIWLATEPLDMRAGPDTALARVIQVFGSARPHCAYLFANKRGKWACNECETLIQAPVLPQVIDKGIPTAGLLAQVLVAKYADHLPLYRQERIFSRAGLEIPRSTLAE